MSHQSLTLSRKRVDLGDAYTHEDMKPRTKTPYSAAIVAHANTALVEASTSSCLATKTMLGMNNIRL